MKIEANFIGNVMQGPHVLGEIKSQVDFQYRKSMPDIQTGVYSESDVAAWKLEFVGDWRKIQEHFKQRGYVVLHCQGPRYREGIMESLGLIYLQKPIL